VFDRENIGFGNSFGKEKNARERGKSAVVAQAIVVYG
jgi:hypothetical protein